MTTTIGYVPGPVTDVRAGVLRRRYHQRFGGVEVPVPVTAIVEDLCGLSIEEDASLDVSGMLLPPERRILPKRFRVDRAPAFHARPRARPLGMPVPRRADRAALLPR